MSHVFYLMLCLFGTSDFHDVPVAYYEIHLDRQPFEITVEMEPGHLYLMTPKKGERPRKAVNNYFSKHLEIELNGKVCEVAVQSIETLPNNHLKVKGRMNCGRIGKPSSIHIQNTAFINVIENQVNSIMIHQKDKRLRGFKMNGERTEIYVDL